MKTWVNGQTTTHLSVYDRGLHYGDGVFETMRVNNGSIVMWTEHFTRLQLGCQRLNINIDPDVISQQLNEIQRQIFGGVLKLIVTRGEAERGYRVDASKAATSIWLYSEATVYPPYFYSEGVDVCLCQTTVSRNPYLAGIKHLNRLESVLARQEWQDEYQEGLMCDEFGNIIEGTMSNFFAIKGDTLITTDLNMSGVMGVMRQHLLDIARQESIPTEVRSLPLAELEEIDAAMLSNSLFGVWPVRRIAKYHYSINALYRHLAARVNTGLN